MSNWRKFEVEITRKETGLSEELRVQSPTIAANLFTQEAARRTTESLWVLTLDGQNGLMGVDHVYSGTATGTSVRIAELFRYAVATGGVGIVLVHNHPSGNHEASDEDINLTAEVVRAARIMDIEMLDHLVVSTSGFTSIRSQRPSMWEGGDAIEQDSIISAVNNALNSINQ
jgi:DNA repair protein RadC